MNRPSEDSKTHNSQYGACNVRAQYYFDSLDTFCDEVKEGGGEATIGKLGANFVLGGRTE